jgi:hypothetical protein
MQPIVKVLYQGRGEINGGKVKVDEYLEIIDT